NRLFFRCKTAFFSARSTRLLSGGASAWRRKSVSRSQCFIREIGHHLHKASPRVRVTVSDDDLQRLRQLGKVPRQAIGHLNRRRQSRGTARQHLGEVLSRVPPPGEKQRDPLPLFRGHNAGSEQPRALARTGALLWSSQSGSTLPVQR